MAGVDWLRTHTGYILVSYRVKLDLNHKPILDRLREIPGFEVEDTSRVGGGFPDAIIGGVHQITGEPIVVYAELKSKRGKMMDNQKAFKEKWEGYLNVVEARRVSDLLINNFGWEKEAAEALDTPEMER